MPRIWLSSIHWAEIRWWAKIKLLEHSRVHLYVLTMFWTMLVKSISCVLELIFIYIWQFAPWILLQEFVKDIVSEVIQRHQVCDFDWCRCLEILLCLDIPVEIWVLVVADWKDCVLDELLLILCFPCKNWPLKLTLLVTDNFHVLNPSVSDVA